MMDSPSAVRFMLKNGAKRRFFAYFLPCVGVSIAGGAVTTLISQILSSRLPDPQTLMSSGDLTPYLPQLGLIYGVSFLVSLLISPLMMGSNAFFMEVSRDHRPPFTSVFAWLGDGKRAKTAFLANLWYTLLSLKYFALYALLPVALNFTAAVFPDGAPDWLAVTVFCITGLLVIVGVVLAYAHMFRYMPALFLLAENPAMSIRQTFSFCGRLMKRRTWEFLLFRLSFIGWNIVSLFTYGLSVLFVTPYIDLSVAGYTNWLVDNTVANYLKNPPADDDPDANLLRGFLQNRLSRDAEAAAAKNEKSDRPGSDSQ